MSKKWSTHTTVGRYDAAATTEGGCAAYTEDTVDVNEDDDDDCISIGDWSQGFLQALAFDEDLPPKFFSYRPYKGAKLRIFMIKLLGILYGMSQAPMDWYKTLHGRMEEKLIGFIRSENDKAVWHHPSGLRVGSHVTVLG